ncbi:MAG: lysophospholipase [Bdellovibrio sp.]|nr:lysophospholipase [Bdellovibrio sp.]
MDLVSDLKNFQIAQEGQSKIILKNPIESLGVCLPLGFPKLPEGWIVETESFISEAVGFKSETAGFKYETAGFKSGDKKTKLFSITCRENLWKNSCSLIILHGLGEHCGRYLHLPHFMQSSFGAVFSYDQRGHGRSEGIRGHAEHFDVLAQDAALFVNQISAKLSKHFGASEIHVLGHSLGAHVALRMMFLNPNLPVKTLTLTSPFLAIKTKVPFYKKILANTLSTIWGSLQLDTALDVHTLSHDPEVVTAYQTDKLVHSKMTPRFYTTMLEAMRNTLHRESGLKPPVQFLVPLLDALVNPETSIRFYKNLKHREKRLKTYPNFFHEPVNEIGKEIVFEDIVSWVKQYS